MKKLIKAVQLFFAAVPCLFLFNSIYAQTNSVTDAFAAMQGSGANQFAGTIVVTVSDTNNVDLVEVSLKNSSGDQLMNHTYQYDVTTGLPSGWTYSRSRNKITLHIGSYAAEDSYIGSARIKDNSGNWSASYRFITN
jgi:hypothetical protein